MARRSSTASMISFLTQFIRQARLAWRLMKDDRVPKIVKFIPVGILLYLILPIDFMPDFIPLLGQLDDFAIILLGLKLFIYLCPKPVAQEHLAEMGHSRA